MDVERRCFEVNSCPRRDGEPGCARSGRQWMLSTTVEVGQSATLEMQFSSTRYAMICHCLPAVGIPPSLIHCLDIRPLCNMLRRNTFTSHCYSSLQLRAWQDVDPRRHPPLIGAHVPPWASPFETTRPAIPSLSHLRPDRWSHIVQSSTPRDFPFWQHARRVACLGRPRSRIPRGSRPGWPSTCRP